MPDAPASPPPPEDLVRQLRAAGCVFAEEEAALLAEAGTAGLAVRVARRIAGEPLEQVLGWAEFAGLRIVVEPGVFVPRRRSELLVTQTVAELAAAADHHGSPDPAAKPVVVDLCCGSGAIGAAIAALVPRAQVYAADVDPRAVACARRNLGPDRVFAGDLYSALPVHLRGAVAVLVVNAPYVPSAEIDFMPREARLYEPTAALDGGADGLDWHRRVAAGANEWLAPHGSLLIETSRRQSHGTRELMAATGLRASVVSSKDLDATVAVGRKG